jgi:uncharacterized repeat protein (TIGR01451 family)
VAATATGTLTNTATVAAPGGTNDPVNGNNSAADTDTIVVPVDLAITKTDGQTMANRGSQVRYSIVVTNNGPNAVSGATVTDNFPGTLNGTINWTCATTGGATCGGAATGSGTLNRTVNMPVNSTITFTTTSGSVSANTGATQLTNTATVRVPTGYLDTNAGNDSAIDTTAIQGWHVGALTATATPPATGGNTWSAAVTVTVHGADHSPVAGVTVSGGWVPTPVFGGGSSGTGGTSCVTGANGQCTLTRAGISTGKTASTFGVTGLALNPNAYQPTLNETGLGLLPNIQVNRP